MNKDFFSEDFRKDRLFEAWIKHLQEVHLQFTKSSFDEFYEGIAVSDLSKNCLGLHLDDGRKLRNIPINSEISSHSSRLDMVFIVLGRNKGKWWPLDILSIGSAVGKQGIHMTVNPLLMGAAPGAAPLGTRH